MLLRVTRRKGRLLALVLAVAMMVSVFCINASAAAYNYKTGSLNGYACKTTASFATSSWALNGTTTYGTTASSIYIRLVYTFGMPNTASTRTITDSRTNSNSSLVALTLSADRAADENVSGSAAGSVTARNGSVWNSETVSVY